MARTLKLRYLGNDISFYIPSIATDAAGMYPSLELAWKAMFGNVASPNMPTQVGYAINQTAAGYLYYYQLVAALVGPSGHNCHNIYMSMPTSHTWDTMWPSDDVLGTNKILVPPMVAGDWTCPNNGRYCTYSDKSATAVNAKVYNENHTQITGIGSGSAEYISFTESQIVLIGVNDWDGFRNATTFNDAKNYCYAYMALYTNSGGNQILLSHLSENYTFLRVLWDFTRVFGGDTEDPTEEPSDDPYSGDDSPYKPSDEGGGDGDKDDPYDPGDSNPEPDVPDISIADSGLISIYTPTTAQLISLANYLWSNDFITSMVKDLYADAMDVIISLGFFPFKTTAAGTKEIRVGNRGTGVTSNYPVENYIKFDMGSINLKSTLGAYIDYAPYTKGDIFIPFVGYVPLDIDAFMGHTIGLKYIVDLCTGSAVAILKRDSDVWQQFACNLLTQIPLSAANYAQMYQTIIGATAILAGAGIAGAAGIGGAAVGGEAAEGAQAIASQSGGAAKAASGIMSAAATKPQIQKSNNLSLSAGLLGNKKAFIQLYRPNLALPSKQYAYQGYPSYIETPLSACKDYTRVSSVNLTVPGATGNELALIDSILKTGFIIGSGDAPSGSGIVLYKNNSPAHQIKKSLTSVATLTGTYRDRVDIMRPVVLIEHDSPVDFDYVYISDFNRCYYVDNVVMVRKGLLEMTLRVDVLNSFATAILANTAIIDKSSSKYNLYLNDDSLKMYQKPLIQQYLFPNALFTQHEFVLIVAGSQT